MGNSQNKQVSQAAAQDQVRGPERPSSEDSPPEEAPLIPPDKFEKFLRCLQGFPFDINENQFKDLAKSLRTVNFNENDLILKKGAPGKGIYLVVDGYCRVTSETGGEVIRLIADEDFFGEVSSFYNKACTATVICGRDGTELLWLPDNALGNFLTTPVDYPLLKWFAKRKYLDVEGTSMDGEIILEMTIEAVENAPIFREWSSPAMKSVVHSAISNSNVVFYPAGNEIFSCGEVDANAFLLLQGNLEILSGRQQSLQILDAGSTGLWFGDEQLFCSTERDISAKANSPCIIATFSRDNFQGIEVNFPSEHAKLMDLCHRWGRLIQNRDKQLHDKYAGQLGLEMTRLVLRKSRLLSLVPAGMIYDIALSLTHKQLRKGELVFAENQERDEMLVVFNGIVSVESDSAVTTRRLDVSDIYYPTDNEPHDTLVKAYEECIIGLFDVSVFKAMQDRYPEGIVQW